MSESNHIICNPIIPGFYPDPSVCRVGDDYYLVNSSFELYPGIPVFHSTDLAHWEQISYAMYKENGFHLNADRYAGGVMAPTIRYHDGLFYIINANFGDRGNFIVTAEDPHGPWSAPHFIDDIPDIDCSLFFDTDGSCYLVSPGRDPAQDNGKAFFLTPYDIQNFHVAGERKKIWNSALRGAWAPEAPHIYHIGDYYYLLTAEGGTEHNHSVCIARSKTIDGWYEGDPANPILTHRHLGYTYPIENIGHADLFDTPDGNWYAVCLGVRIIEGQHMNLGRETFLCPVRWERGWPICAPETGRVEWEYPADPSLPWNDTLPTPVGAEPVREDFDCGTLDLCFSFWGAPYQDFWSIEDSCLKLACLPRPLDRDLTQVIPEKLQSREDNVSFLGRRQRTIDFTFTVKMDFTAKNHEAAGLMIMQATNHQYRLEKFCENGRQMLRLILVTSTQNGFPFSPDYQCLTTRTVVHQEEISDGEIILRLSAKGQDYQFLWGTDENDLHVFVAHADGRLINPEEVGGMVGSLLGVFATSNGSVSDNKAAFDWMETKFFE